MYIAGHRGAPGYVTENTLSSFNLAIEMGVDMVECDVHRTADDQIIIMHDFTVDRMTDAKGNVASYTLSELRQIKIKDGQSIPTLRDLFDLVDKRCTILIELKAENTAEAVAEIVKEYIETKGWQPAHFMVQSFNFDELRKFKAKLPVVDIATLSQDTIRSAEYAEDLGARVANVRADVLTDQYIHDAHSRGLRMGVWGVNKANEVEKLKALSVDMVITDYPDVIKRALRPKEASKNAFIDYAKSLQD